MMAVLQGLLNQADNRVTAEPLLGEEPARRVEQTLAGLGLPALTPIDLEIGGNLDTHGPMIICQS